MTGISEPRRLMSIKYRMLVIDCSDSIPRDVLSCKLILDLASWGLLFGFVAAGVRERF